MRVTSISRVDSTHYAVTTDILASDGVTYYACDYMHITDASWFDRSAQAWVSGKALKPHYDGSGIFPPTAVFTVPLTAEKLAELLAM